MTALPPVASLVPHRPPMVLLDEVRAWDGATARCRLTVRPDAPFAVEGRVPAAVALEYMAQCAAVHGGLGARDRGEPARGGYLLGARSLSLAVDHFDAGDVLDVEARREDGDGTLEHYEAAVHRAGARVAWASLSVYRGVERP